MCESVRDPGASPLGHPLDKSSFGLYYVYKVTLTRFASFSKGFVMHLCAMLSVCSSWPKNSPEGTVVIQMVTHPY